MNFSIQCLSPTKEISGVICLPVHQPQGLEYLQNICVSSTVPRTERRHIANFVGMTEVLISKNNSFTHFPKLFLIFTMNFLTESTVELSCIM